jgi:AAA domain/KH domain
MGDSSPVQNTAVAVNLLPLNLDTPTSTTILQKEMGDSSPVQKTAVAVNLLPLNLDTPTSTTILQKEMGDSSPAEHQIQAVTLPPPNQHLPQATSQTRDYDFFISFVNNILTGGQMIEQKLSTREVQTPFSPIVRFFLFHLWNEGDVSPHTQRSLPLLEAELKTRRNTTRKVRVVDFSEILKGNCSPNTFPITSQLLSISYINFWKGLSNFCLPLLHNGDSKGDPDRLCTLIKRFFLEPPLTSLEPRVTCHLLALYIYERLVRSLFDSTGTTKTLGRNIQSFVRSWVSIVHEVCNTGVMATFSAATIADTNQAQAWLHFWGGAIAAAGYFCVTVSSLTEVPGIQTQHLEAWKSLIIAIFINRDARDSQGFADAIKQISDNNESPDAHISDYTGFLRVYVETDTAKKWLLQKVSQLDCVPPRVEFAYLSSIGFETSLYANVLQTANTAVTDRMISAGIITYRHLQRKVVEDESLGIVPDPDDTNQLFLITGTAVIPDKEQQAYINMLSNCINAEGSWLDNMRRTWLDIQYGAVQYTLKSVYNKETKEGIPLDTLPTFLQGRRIEHKQDWLSISFFYNLQLGVVDALGIVSRPGSYLTILLGVSQNSARVDVTEWGLGTKQTHSGCHVVRVVSVAKDKSSIVVEMDPTYANNHYRLLFATIPNVASNQFLTSGTCALSPGDFRDFRSKKNTSKVAITEADDAMVSSKLDSFQRAIQTLHWFYNGEVLSSFFDIPRTDADATTPVTKTMEYKTEETKESLSHCYRELLNNRANKSVAVLLHRTASLPGNDDGNNDNNDNNNNVHNTIINKNINTNSSNDSDVLQKRISDDNIFVLKIYGPPGTGKTTVAIAIVSALEQCRSVAQHSQTTTPSGTAPAAHVHRVFLTSTLNVAAAVLSSRYPNDVVRITNPAIYQQTLSNTSAADELATTTLARIFSADYMTSYFEPANPLLSHFTTFLQSKFGNVSGPTNTAWAGDKKPPSFNAIQRFMLENNNKINFPNVLQVMTNIVDLAVTYIPKMQQSVFNHARLFDGADVTDADFLLHNREVQYVFTLLESFVLNSPTRADVICATIDSLSHPLLSIPVMKDLDNSFERRYKDTDIGQIPVSDLWLSFLRLREATRTSSILLDEASKASAFLDVPKVVFHIRPTDYFISAGDENQGLPWLRSGLKLGPHHVSIMQANSANKLKYPHVTINLNKCVRCVPDIVRLFDFVSAGSYPFKIQPGDLAQKLFFHNGNTYESMPGIIRISSPLSAERTLDKSSGSSFNKAEAILTSHILQYLRDNVYTEVSDAGSTEGNYALLNDSKSCNISVLTAYAAQRELLQTMLGANSEVPTGVSVKFKTVDASQGDTVDISIVSLVITELDVKKDFVTNFRRLFVLLTRAKFLIILVHHPNLITEETNERKDFDHLHRIFRWIKTFEESMPETTLEFVSRMRRHCIEAKISSENVNDTNNDDRTNVNTNDNNDNDSIIFNNNFNDNYAGDGGNNNNNNNLNDDDRNNAGNDNNNSNNDIGINFNNIIINNNNNKNNNNNENNNNNNINDNNNDNNNDYNQSSFPDEVLFTGKKWIQDDKNVGEIIGKRGNNINRIRRSRNVQSADIVNSTGGSPAYILITGSWNAIQTAFSEIDGIMKKRIATYQPTSSTKRHRTLGEEAAVAKSPTPSETAAEERRERNEFY